ncbi:GNAT family N-acetyltransferase [Mycobacterium sp. ACS4331]|uniref:N-acetylglutamate synthase, CG3035 family n=1 Tax=Mycobacterium sp. ACS4331 TaxID=1834121 RepID=UPI0007FCF0EE|nr:GNAT family N-acetyltransferase [Mycobacterium sp. ACS4331]OBF18005.1 GCN5 family acetyltransferase [Mycobacterium sp. ACS4331]
MVELPAVGSRVSLRHRLPPGSAKPLTDVVGHLVAVGTDVLVRTKSGETVTVAAADVVAVRELSHSPVRASEIRALEHAAASAWPGVEQQWLNGWLLRFGHGVTSRANSAVPLDISAQLSDLLEIVDWYRQRDLPAWLALPERLLPVRADGVKHTRVMVRDVGEHDSGPAASFASVPDADWLRVYERDVPVDVLSAVVDGEVTFARIGDAAVGRGAVTSAPDGTRWLGISSVRVAAERRRRGFARSVCEALLAWGATHGAQRTYVQVLADNAPAVALYTSMGFRLHHACRYVAAESLVRHVGGAP